MDAWYPCEYDEGGYNNQNVSSDGEMIENDMFLVPYVSTSGNEYYRFRHDENTYSLEPLSHIIYNTIVEKVDWSNHYIRFIDGNEHNVSIENMEVVLYDIDHICIDFENIDKGRYFFTNDFGIWDSLKCINVKQRNASNGYAYVSLHTCNGNKLFLMHRIIAKHFVNNPKPDKYNVVNHINGNSMINYPYNLEWCDQKINSNHAAIIQHMTPLSVDVIDEIRLLLLDPVNHGSSKEVFDKIKFKYPYVTLSMIYTIKHNKAYRRSNMFDINHITFPEYTANVISTDIIDMIRDMLVKYNKSPAEVYRNLNKDLYPYISYTIIKSIKYSKKEYCRSNRYNIDDFINMMNSNKINGKGDKKKMDGITNNSNDTLDLCRSLLILAVFHNSPTMVYDIINHGKYPNLSINILKKLAYDDVPTSSYYRSNKFDLKKYYNDIADKRFIHPSKELIDHLTESYSHGNPDITDEGFDLILEDYIAINGENSRPFRQNKGETLNSIDTWTLPKVYLSPRENQKSYLDWLRVKNVDENTKIIAQPKFDGCSVAYDVTTDEYFTRGDYDNGESVNVTSLFRGYFKQEDFDLYKTQAVKCEAIMCHEVFKELGLDKTYKRPRDVVSATITSQNIDMAKYITLVPLRVYERGNLFVSDEVGEISLFTTAHNRDGINEFVNSILEDGATVKFNDFTYSIDGVVVSTVDDEDVHINKEVAIKILNNVKETKLLRIEYQYGKTGKITPVGILEPVMFDNVTVDHVGLSTLDRVMKLELRYNDTVRIVYNIVPYLIDTYHDGTIPIPIPTKCPICGAELNFKTLKTVRCTNPQCSGLKVGMIHRYCEKMKMMGIAKNTLTKLFEAGLVQCIGDLYRLTPEKIMALDGYKEKSATNICTSILNASKDVPLDRWMGAMPIKDISAKTWRLVINAKFHGDEMMAVNKYKYHIENGTVDSFMMECIPDYVHGFSTNTYAAIKEGLVLYWDEIKDAIQFISFYTLTKPTNIATKGRVTLTGTRDAKLIDYLTNKGYEVADFSSKTQFLIIPNKGYVSSKVVKAHKMNIPIYTIEEAFEAL